MYVSEICATGIFVSCSWWLKNVKSRSKIALFPNKRHFVTVLILFDIQVLHLDKKLYLFVLYKILTLYVYYSGFFKILSVPAYRSGYCLTRRGCIQIVNKRKVLTWHHAKLHLQ